MAGLGAGFSVQPRNRGAPEVRPVRVLPLNDSEELWVLATLGPFRFSYRHLICYDC